MAPWWSKHPKKVEVCLRCRGSEHLHDGLCRRCRAQLRLEETRGGETRNVPPADKEVPTAVTLEPPHARPWVHRDSG
jgi:hypothetical protein